MSADNFTGQNISSTFQRLLQLSDNGNGVTDGTGSLVTFLPINVNNALTASYVSGVTVFNTGSFLVTASANLNTITFTKGDGSTFPITVNTGSSGTTTTASYVTQLNQDVLISGSITVLDTDNYNVFTAGNGETFARNLDVQSRLRVSSDSTGRGRIIVEELSAGVADTIYNPTAAALIATSGSVKMSGSISITGSLDVTGSFGLFTRGTTPPTGTPSRIGLFYFTDTDLYISLQ